MSGFPGLHALPPLCSSRPPPAGHRSAVARPSAHPGATEQPAQLPGESVREGGMACSVPPPRAGRRRRWESSIIFLLKSGETNNKNAAGPHLMRTEYKSHRRKPFLSLLPFSGPEAPRANMRAVCGSLDPFKGLAPPQARSCPLPARGGSGRRPRLRARDLEEV